MGRKRKLFNIEFQDERFLVRCRQCGDQATVSYTRGPKVTVSCEPCGMATDLKISSWSKYLRAVKVSPKSEVELSEPLVGTAVLSKTRNEQVDHGDSEIVKPFGPCGGVPLKRDSYLHHGSFTPPSPYNKPRDEDEENESGVGFVSDKVQKFWSKKYRHATPQGV